MSKQDHEQIVVAMFDSEAAADQAMEAMKSWEKANDDVKLGSIGTITKENGKVKTHLGRKTGKGSTVGVVLGMLAAVLSGGLTLLGGVVGGGILGAIGGSFLKKSGGLTKDEIQDIGAHLESGGAAVIVSVDPHEVEDTAAHLTEAGGTVRNYEVPSDTVKETAQSIDHTGEVKSTAPAAASTTDTDSDDDGDDVAVGVDAEGDVVAEDSAGDVAVEDAEGDVVATDAEGDVAVEDAEGDVAVEDAEGDVAVEDAEGDVAVEDAEGDVAVSMADDLTKIEGIGPKIGAALNAVGIVTYVGLSGTQPAALHAIIKDAGLHAPAKVIATWPAQAACAAQGDWDGMKAVYEESK